MAEEKNPSTTIKFLYGSRAGIETKVEEGTIDGSDLVITSDTDELVFVDKNKEIHPLKSRTEKEHVILNTSIGGLANGAHIQPGIDLDEFIELIAHKKAEVTYKKPEVTLEVDDEASQPGVYEVGEEVTTSLIGTFVKNDAGQLASIELLQDGQSILSSALSPITDEVTFTVPNGEVKFVAKATHGEGLVKDDVDGNPVSKDHILAGSVESEPIVFSGARYMFMGIGENDLSAVDSAFVRSLDVAVPVPENTEVFRIEMPAGYQWIAVAAPVEEVGYEPIITYVEASDPSMIELFDTQTVSVEGANGYTASDYTVYTYHLSIPAPATMNFDIEF